MCLCDRIRSTLELRKGPRLVSSNGALGVRVREHVHMMRVRVGERRRAAVAVGMRGGAAVAVGMGGGAGVGVDVGVQVRLVLRVAVARLAFGQAVLVVEQRGGLIWPVLSGSRGRCGVVHADGRGRGRRRRERAGIQTRMAAFRGLRSAVQL